jgi:hypothetical protein
MKTRIAVYGGTDLPPSSVAFVRQLTRSLLAFDDVVLVSGGFAWYKQHPERTSVDRAVLVEAEESLDAKGLDERFETWLPAPALDRRSGIRFRRGSVRELAGSAQARRFVMVNAVDAIITIGGEGHTRTVLELAMAIEKPVLPVAFTGGDSERIWPRSRDDLASALHIQPASIRRLELRPRTSKDRSKLAVDVARAAYDAAEKRCLVLMPFGRGHDGFYKDVLRPTIADAGFVPRRLDKDEYAGDIPTLFLTSLEKSHAILVDVTGANPNVMYELGQVHARMPVRPAVVLRERLTMEASAALPFYLRHERLIAAPDEPAGHRHIALEVKQYLASIDRRRGHRRPA